MARILIIDDDVSFSSSLAETITDFRHEALIAPSGEEGLNASKQTVFALIFLDLRMTGMGGLEVLRQLKSDSAFREIPVIVLTAFADTANTIEAMKLGAFDHITKPIGRDDVKAILERALARSSTIAQIASVEGPSDALIGLSPAMRDVQKNIGIAAASEDATVLVRGKTGTGKELVARAVHHHSSRSNKPFVAVNCAAIPAGLLESELFGHVRGSFTGATQHWAGRFKQADGGTLFLDEIGDMSLAMQAKILRVLQDKMVTPVGGEKPQKINVRIIAATLQDLVVSVKEGKFREDLFYRLNVFSISLPPLCERGSDILVLAEHFLQHAQVSPAKKLSTAAAKALLEYSWPGNVRELQNMMQNLSLSVRTPVIERKDLRLKQSSFSGDSTEELLQLPYHQALAKLEKIILQRALQATGGNRAEAARRLDINRQLLYAKIEEHGLGDGKN